MKVKDLQTFLSKLDPEQTICALVYEKSAFEYDPEDEVELTDASWEKICEQFDEMPFSDIWESISMAVSEFATEKE
jgi:hypothetical protein